MLLMIDNYDSFTWNLVQYLQVLGAEVRVVRNDELSVDGIEALAPERIVISPGPCTPNEAGVSVGVIGRLGATTPILGVCLGHQSIGQAYGGDVVRAGRIMHGKTSEIRHTGAGVFAGLPNGFTATRYHSLAVSPQKLPDCLEITAWSEQPAPEALAGADDHQTIHSDGVEAKAGVFEEIMGLRHREHPVQGVQFHPESILTQHGHALLRNFLER
ncbi:MAG TPA: aminodeoxychorismate/anthranilate synthase component II [Xanthomonadaceae bacterium]|nr:aminodeoxychorismate/anthranilate synthase component II [Xanthomonadaceae bacterium]